MAKKSAAEQLVEDEVLNITKDQQTVQKEEEKHPSVEDIVGELDQPTPGKVKIISRK